MGETTEHAKSRTATGIVLAILLATSVSTLAGLSVMPTASATFSGENGKIAFVSNRDGNAEIYVIDADGTDLVNLSNNAADDYYPRWSPDGTKIAFVSYRDIATEIYVMDADGTNPVNVSNNTNLDLEPSWSPDGTKIAFWSTGKDNPELADIYIMDADGMNQVKVSDNAAHNAGFRWSPDGTKIAYESISNGNREVYVMNADGTNQVNVSNNAAFDGLHSWSPDGAKIIFTSNRDDGNYEIYVMNPDGTGKTRLTSNSREDFRPVYSPDGTKIAFWSAEEDDPELADIYVMNADGTNQVNVSNNAVHESNPRWSPDGTKIAFASWEGNDEIYVMNADGTSQANVSDNPAFDGEFEWRPLPATKRLTISSVDQSGNPLKGMWITVRTPDGTLLKSGFTPLTFSGNPNAAYKVSVANYDGRIFQHWEDGSTSKARTISSLNEEDRTLTATFDQGDSIRGYTSLTYAGTPEQPDLTVNATTLDGSRTLHMWIIIDPQSSNATGTTYKVYASNYKDRVFNHWGDGSTDRIRTLTIEQDTTITAYYKVGGRE